MTKIVRGAGRARYTAAQAKHAQRTPFGGGRDVQADHTQALRDAVTGHRLKEVVDFGGVFFRWYCSCGAVGGRRGSEATSRADFEVHANGG